MNENTIMETKIIYESENFKVCVPSHPHVSREEGGHLIIRANGDKYRYDSRLDFNEEEVVEQPKKEISLDSVDQKMMTIDDFLDDFKVGDEN